MKNKTNVTSMSKSEEFEKDLKNLLLKYDAEINLAEDDQEYGYSSKMIVHFNYDQELFKKTGWGVSEEIDLGNWVWGESI